jgi:hypothetical protein
MPKVKNIFEFSTKGVGMHASALKAGQLFFQTYWQDTFSNILDIGSRDFNGTLRLVASAASNYTGIDLEAVPGVDRVLADPYIPILSRMANLIASYLPHASNMIDFPG